MTEITIKTITDYLSTEDHAFGAALAEKAARHGDETLTGKAAMAAAIDGLLDHYRDCGSKMSKRRQFGLATCVVEDAVAKIEGGEALHIIEVV